jgi:hypothetical protein
MWQRFVIEMRKFAVIASFLFFFFGAFSTYRRLILAQYQIDYFVYGYSLIESLVLAKVVLLGDLLHLGDRFRGKPLIIPTVYRTFVFAILVLVFTVLEEVAKGVLHGEGATTVLARLAAMNRAEIAAKILIVFIVFIPMFAIWQIANVFGPGKLFELFFEQRSPLGAQLVEKTTAPPA